MERRDFLKVLGVGTLTFIRSAYADKRIRFPLTPVADQTDGDTNTIETEDAKKLAELVLSRRKKGIKAENETYYEAKKENEFGYQIVEVAFTRQGWDYRIGVNNYQDVPFSPLDSLSIILGPNRRKRFGFMDEGLDGRCNKASLTGTPTIEEWQTHFGLIPDKNVPEEDQKQQLYRGLLQQLIRFYEAKK